MKLKFFTQEKLSPKELAKDYGFILIGTLLMAIAFVVFISPLKLAPGGVYGIAIILHHLFNFPIGISGIALDIPLLIIGTLWLGPKFGMKTVVGIVSLSGFITLIEYLYGYKPLIGLAENPSIPDPAANFIIALCGGVLLGIGLGLIFKTRATSGGTDIVAMILGKYAKHIPLGTLLIIVDSFIVLGALAAFDDWTIPLYSWLIIYVTGIVVDKVISGFAAGKAVIIISDKYEEIKERILADLNRGGTFLNGEGMYNRTEKKIIYTTLSRKQLPQLIHFVHEIDSNAFISILNASDVFGEGFTSLKEKASE
ncbi:MAG: YitT family protein [Bacteroidales bacterium]|nr:YitT family protein [Bacteroidales bacterium]MDD4208900.1 YitT family protein [Bacteroidales bacterium]